MALVLSRLPVTCISALTRDRLAASGTIDREELGTVLRSCMEESSLVLSEENLQALTDALFDDADADKSGEITFEKLKDQLEKHPGVMQNLTIRWGSKTYG